MAPSFIPFSSCCVPTARDPAASLTYALIRILCFLFQQPFRNLPDDYIRIAISLAEIQAAPTGAASPSHISMN